MEREREKKNHSTIQTKPKALRHLSDPEKRHSLMEIKTSLAVTLQGTGNVSVRHVNEICLTYTFVDPRVIELQTFTPDVRHLCDGVVRTVGMHSDNTGSAVCTANL